MSLDMSVPQGIPALQQKNLAWRKQLRRAEEDHRDALEQIANDSQKALKRAEEDHRDALEQAARDSQKALKRAEEDHRDALELSEKSHQQTLVRAHQDRHDAQDSLFQALETNRSLVQQLKDLREQSQATAEECLELRQELEELKEEHQLVIQDCSHLRQELDKLREERRLATQQLQSHQNGSELHGDYLADSDEPNPPVRQDKTPETRLSSVTDLDQRSASTNEADIQDREEPDPSMSVSMARVNEREYHSLFHGYDKHWKFNPQA